VRLHIPELADTGAVVTIGHLMHNTAGVRDMLEIMRLGGVDLSMPVAPEDLMAGICRQRTLNFAPGSRYLYSNSNFLLLGRIVERVSGETLRDFLQRRIFGPCGMTQTRMVESTTEVVCGLATGYLPGPAGGWVRAQHAFPMHGEGALVSSVTDLALWHRACANLRLGPTLAEALTATVPFTGGTMNDYANGLRVSAVRGIGTISHGGLWPGYKTEFLRIPERDAAVIVIANNGSADPSAIGQQILAHLIDGVPGVPPAPGLPEQDVLARHAGRFLNPAGPATVDFAMSAAGTLTGSTNGVPFGVRSAGDGRLCAARSARDFTFRLASDGASLHVEQDAGHAGIWHRVAEGATLPDGLPGSYHSAELAATWRFHQQDGAMVLHVAGPVANAGPWPVEAIEGDIFRIWTPGTLFRGWIDVRAVRDAAGAITGLFANSNRVKRLVLTRQEGSA